MSREIDGYLVGYFLPTVREVLDPLLADHGLRWVGEHEQASAHWTSGWRFLRVGYLPETAPDYELLLGVGESDAWRRQHIQEHPGALPSLQPGEGQADDAGVP